MVSFEIEAEEVNVTITCKGANASNAKYMKYGPLTPGDSNKVLYDFSNYASHSGNSWILHLKDNAIGDDTGDDGIIVDAGGPVGFTAVPLSNASKLLLALFFGLAALLTIRRQRVLR